jgi:surfeit locus 1 family protein
MKKIRLGPVVFRMALLPGIVFICLLPLLIALGIWQLGRAKDKEVLLALQTQRMHDSALQLTAASSADPESLRYRAVKAAGRYDAAHQFLIDNRILNGRAGYYVLTPFIIQNSGLAVLVNRGWIPVNADRSLLPDVTMAADAATVTGRINSFPAVGLKLAGAEIPADGWPSVVQVAESAILAKRLGYALFDFQLEMDAGQPLGYVREWKTATPMPPEKHRAYAFQWFGLALTLVILFIWLSCKKNTDE